MLRLLLLFSIFGLTSCGQGGPETSTTSATASPRPLFVVLGGNNTCGSHNGFNHSPYAMRLARKLHDIKTHVAARYGRESRFVVTCYRDDNPTVYYATSDAPDDVQSNHRREIVVDLVTEMQQREAGSLFVIGYSYGGWLSMKTAVDLADNFQMASFLTIDPISRVHCTYRSPLGCTSAPRDIHSADLERVHSSTRWWANYFQTETFYLHSSSIAQAHQNSRVNASHSGIDGHEEVWTTMGQLIDLYL